MNHMMPDGMMSGAPLLWIVLGFLLGLLLVAAVVWLTAGFRNVQKLSLVRSTPQFRDTPHTYEQGYQPLEASPETYQEGGHSYSYPQPQYEQPTAQYPQEMPLQQ